MSGNIPGLTGYPWRSSDERKIDEEILDEREAMSEESQRKMAAKLHMLLRESGLDIPLERVTHHNSHGLYLAVDLEGVEKEAEAWVRKGGLPWGKVTM